jgi:hypothetical protein
VALPGQVEEPARCADDDVDACQRLDLRLVCAAAIQGDDAGADLRASGPQVVADLDSQLARWYHHERPWRLGLPRHVSDVLQDRDPEGEGLAGAGSGLSDQVMAVQGDRQSQRLDGESSDDAVGFQRGADGLGDAEVAERLGAREVLTVRALCVGTQGSRLQ